MTLIEWLAIVSTLSGESLRTFYDRFKKTRSVQDFEALSLVPMARLLSELADPQLSGIWRLAKWNYQISKHPDNWEDTGYGTEGNLIILNPQSARTKNRKWRGILHIKYDAAGTAMLRPMRQLLGKNFEGIYDVNIRRQGRSEKLAGSTHLIWRRPVKEGTIAGEMEMTLAGGSLKGQFQNIHHSTPMSRCSFIFHNKQPWREISDSAIKRFVSSAKQ